GAERRADDVAPMLEGRGEWLAGAGVPDPRRVVGARGDDAPPVGAERGPLQGGAVLEPRRERQGARRRPEQHAERLPTLTLLAGGHEVRHRLLRVAVEQELPA